MVFAPKKKLHEAAKRRSGLLLFHLQGTFDVVEVVMWSSLEWLSVVSFLLLFGAFAGFICCCVLADSVHVVILGGVVVGAGF